MSFHARNVLLAALLGLHATACQGSIVNQVDPSDYFQDPGALKLAEAACAGDGEEVASLVNRGQSPNVRGRGGTTPLFVAVSCQSEDGVTALLRAGADANSRLDSGENPVWVAAGWANTAILAALLDHGGDMHVMASRGETPLIRSLDPYLPESNFRLLLERGVDVNQADEDGGTAAFHAVVVGRMDLALELIDAGFRYDPVDLAVSVRNTVVSDNQRPFQEKMKIVLSELGVATPLPELLNAEGRIGYMTANPEYAKAHPESWPIGHPLHPGVAQRGPAQDSK
jgi:ankyrin repeat protein